MTMITIPEIPVNESTNTPNICKPITEFLENITDHTTILSVDSNNWGLINPIVEMCSKIDGINADTKNRVLTSYMHNADDSMRYVYNDDSYNNYFGIYINIEASTHFNEARYLNSIHLSGAEKILAQTPRHFLKIFKNKNKRILFVYSNQEIEIETFYKLKLLQNKLDSEYIEKFDPITTRFYEALNNKDVDAFNRVLNDLNNSDRVKEIQMKKFLSLFESQTNKKINSLESEIRRIREDISYYENQIASEATSLRLKSEEIERLKNNTENTEELKDLYKYLNRHPHIYKVKPVPISNLWLTFHSPIKYYSDYAIEKMLPNFSNNEKKLLKIFLEKRYTLMTECCIEFNVSNFNTRMRHMDTTELTLFGHPHINRYNCFGNHRSAIADSAKHNDHLGAIEQINQMTMNVNFYDTCVIRSMLKDLLGPINEGKQTWYDEVTGEMLTTEEVLERSE